MTKSVYDAIAAKLDCSPRTVRRVLRGELAKINRSRLIRMLMTPDTDEGASA